MQLCDAIANSQIIIQMLLTFKIQNTKLNRFRQSWTQIVIESVRTHSPKASDEIIGDCTFYKDVMNKSSNYTYESAFRHHQVDIMPHCRPMNNNISLMQSFQFYLSWLGIESQKHQIDRILLWICIRPVKRVQCEKAWKGDGQRVRSGAMELR